MDNVPYNSFCNSVSAGQFCLRNLASSVVFSYLNCFCPSKLVIRVPLTPGRSALKMSVPAIFSICTEPKVIGIYTGGIISTGTVVKYTEVTRNRPVVNDPGKSVCRGMGSAVDSVSIPVFISSPQPAGIRFVNFAPKSTDQIRRDNQFFSHVSYSGSDLFTKQSGPLLQRTELIP